MIIAHHGLGFFSFRILKPSMKKNSRTTSVRFAVVIPLRLHRQNGKIRQNWHSATRGRQLSVSATAKPIDYAAISLCVWGWLARVARHACATSASNGCSNSCGAVSSKAQTCSDHRGRHRIHTEPPARLLLFQPMGESHVGEHLPSGQRRVVAVNRSL